MKKENKIDWNFLINFSPCMRLLFGQSICNSSMFESQAQAEEIEEVAVVAQQTKTIEADLLKESSL